MKFHLIYLNYDFDSTPIGRVESFDNGADLPLESTAIVPTVVLHDDGPNEVVSWGLVQRTRVDTRPDANPRERLGEEARADRSLPAG